MPEKLYRIKPLNFKEVDGNVIMPRIGQVYYCNYHIVEYQIVVTYSGEEGADINSIVCNVLISYIDGKEIPYVCNDLEAAIQHCNRHWTDFLKLNFVDEAS